MTEILLKCTACGHEEHQPRVNIYTGVHFDGSFTILCHCRADMYVIPHEPGKHVSECEKVLAKFGEVLV